MRFRDENDLSQDAVLTAIVKTIKFGNAFFSAAKKCVSKFITGRFIYFFYNFFQKKFTRAKARVGPLLTTPMYNI